MGIIKLIVGSTHQTCTKDTMSLHESMLHFAARVSSGAGREKSRQTRNVLEPSLPLHIRDLESIL